MYILIVARGYPTRQSKMNGIFEFDQACALAEAGHKIVYAAVDLRSIRRWRKWGIEHFVKDGVEVYAINIPLGRVPHRVLSVCGKWGLKTLYRKIEKEHGTPDIIHSHFAGISEISYSLKGCVPAKFVASAHDGYPEKPYWMKSVESCLYPKFDAIIGVSEQVASELSSKGINSYVIPNVLDRIFVNCNEHNMQSKSMDFVFIGSLDEGKGPLRTIMAFYKAFYGKENDTYSALPKLFIVGDGSQLKDCQNCINNLGLTNKVQMLGMLQRKEIAKILKDSVCFVLPSQGETFGVAYIEAMACGLPVIATRCGGPEFFVNETNGVLIPVNDEQALVNAFRYMFAHAKDYDSEKIAEETKAKFSPQTIAAQLTELYKKVLE